MRSHKIKSLPKTKVYRNYKNFDKNDFENHLLATTRKTSDIDQFTTEFKNTLDIHAPLKKKIIRANDKPFMNKTLKKNDYESFKTKKHF